MEEIAIGSGWELCLGRWQECLVNKEVDVLICDPPYSERTHLGHDTGSRSSIDSAKRVEINYSPWSEEDVEAFVDSWSYRVRGWFVVLTDHVLAPYFEKYLSNHGRYVFAPIPFVARGSRVRMLGDGPSSWTTWIIVARPRSEPWSKWGTLDGAYVLPRGFSDRRLRFAGSKPLWLMQSLVRDYSRVGELVVDPVAGMATTLLAAAIEGRYAIGSELDTETFELAVERLSKGYTPSFCF